MQAQHGKISLAELCTQKMSASGRWSTQVPFAHPLWERTPVSVFREQDQDGGLLLAANPWVGLYVTFPIGDCSDVLDIALLRLPNAGCTEPGMGLFWWLLPPCGMGHEWKVMLWSFPTLVSLLIFRKVTWHG